MVYDGQVFVFFILDKTIGYLSIALFKVVATPFPLPM